MACNPKPTRKEAKRIKLQEIREYKSGIRSDWISCECGWDFFWIIDDAHGERLKIFRLAFKFKYTGGGESYNGNYTQHWFECFLKCPICNRKIYYGDSD